MSADTDVRPRRLLAQQPLAEVISGWLATW
jgi:hypothetical protein